MLGDRLALHSAAGLLTAVILAPLAAPGYVLSYDMNFVPAQPLRLGLVAPVDILPRAVPLDAMVSLANVVMPGWLLQRVVLVAIIWVAVVGAGRLTPTDSTAIRVVAGVGYGWTPFLAERLLLGQWALLIAYAALPWLISAAAGYRRGEPKALAKLVIAAGLSALTPSGGLITAVLCLILLWGMPWRRWATAMTAVMVLNLPWLIAAMLTTAAGQGDPAGVTAFSARAENWGGAVVSLLGTGGIWNQETTPASRSSPLVPWVTLALLLIAIRGYLTLRERMQGRFPAVALGGLALAALGTIQIGASLHHSLTTWLPGVGLLRDSHKLVLPYALLLVICVALGAEWLAAKLPVEAGRVAMAGVVLLFVAVMPDLAYGGAGALRPVSYPAEWATVSRIVAADPGEVLSLPLSEYRHYPWNRDRVVMDVAPRYLPAPVLADDILVIGDVALAGENPRLPAIRSLLTARKPLTTTGVAWVLVQHRGSVTDAVPAPSLDGLQPVFQGDLLSLYRNPTPAPAGHPNAWRQWSIVAAEIVALLLLIVATARIAAAPRR